MSLRAGAILLMVEYGLTGEQIARIAVANEGHDTVTEKRRAYDRERKRVAKERALSGGIPAEIPAELSAKEIPPRPPKEKLNPLSTVRASLFPVDPPQPVAKPKPVAKRRPMKRCPDDWKPSPSVLEVGAEVGFGPREIDHELNLMRDHEYRTAKVDWDAAARRWLRQAAQWRTQHAGHLTARPGGIDRRQAASDSKLADVGAAMEAALWERARERGGG